jgi:hypothetical protein
MFIETVKGGGFTISTITYKVGVYAPAERADTLPLLHVYPYIYSVTTLQHALADTI